MASLMVEAKAWRMKERLGISEHEEARSDAQLESVCRRYVALSISNISMSAVRLCANSKSAQANGRFQITQRFIL